MAYAGYLVKIGNYTLPFRYIKAESYKVVRSVTDLDSYRDADGVLHRTALPHILYKCEFETPAMLTNSDIATLMAHIHDNYTNEAERKVNMTIYVPETDGYVENVPAYIPDINFTIYAADNSQATPILKYNSIRFALIGY